MLEIPFSNDRLMLMLVQDANSPFVMPCQFDKVRTTYGEQKGGGFHPGIGLKTEPQTLVKSCFDGVVRMACDYGDYGTVVVVRHYNGLETLYGHLSQIKVKPKQVVEAGTLIGLGGNTGNSTGPHLHFETRFLYESFDPEWVIDIEKRSLRTRTLHLDKSYFGVHAPRGRKAQEFKADKSYVKETPRRTNTGPIYYTTQYGDDWNLLAERYKTTVEALRVMNPDAPKKLKPGIKLMVRKATSN